MIYHIGIDVGLHGALAIIDDQGRLLEEPVSDMPVYTYAAGKRSARTYDAARIFRILSEWQLWLKARHKEVFAGLAVFERLHAMPKGSVAGFSMGLGSGLVEMALVAHQIPYRKVPPPTWKKHFGLLRCGKGKSREIAQQAFPGVDLGKRSDEGRAEALLLALYAKLVNDGKCQL